VSCPSCGHGNPADARFCNGCGAHLAAPTVAPEPRSYTPRHLFEKILASRSALRGERKLVTVLFADVVRSMELAERVDPEEWHRLLDRLFRILAAGVHRYEGTINQYTGDGIMALFGAPIAHEDHAQRACAAALDLARELGVLAEDVRRESGLEFAVRMGLNSGEVVVGRIGDDLRMDYTAQGHVVGLAARVQQLAPPGGITVTEQTARLAEGFFDFLDRGDQRLKGASVPVHVLELRGPGQIRSRLESSRARGFSRFVGREPELTLLDSALRAAQSGRPTVVLVTGEPGAGKSRLCFELVERARGLALHHARALSHGRMLPFHVIVALARGLFGVGEGAAPSDVRNAVRRALGSVQADPIALDFWLDLLGVSDHVATPSGLDPDARRARLFRSLLDLIRARGQRELTLLWVEDLHWLDPASEAALEMLIERLLAPESAGSRILVLATTRPEYRPTWSRRVESLSLAPLRQQDCQTLLDDWLGSGDALSPLRTRIEARARGNPLFVEEMIRSLLERGALRGERGAYELAAPIEEVVLPESIGSRTPTRTCSRPLPWSGKTCQPSCCAPWSICPRPSSPRHSSASRQPSFSARPSLRVSTPSAILLRRRSLTAHSFSIAGVKPTAPSPAPCSPSTGRRPPRTRRSSPITSTRPASASRRHTGTSGRVDASHAMTRRMGRDIAIGSPPSWPPSRSPARP
jgi:class 3 adenylate cyclase